MSRHIIFSFGNLGNLKVLILESLNFHLVCFFFFSLYLKSRTGLVLLVKKTKDTIFGLISQSCRIFLRNSRLIKHILFKMQIIKLDQMKLNS